MENPTFDASYERIFGSSLGLSELDEGFFTRFYERFLAHEPIKKLFATTDMTRQVSMLKKSMFHLITFYITASPTSELERMAEIHHTIGLNIDLYDLWLQSLVETVAEFDGEYDLSVELAWKLALSPGITYMKLYGT